MAAFLANVGVNASHSAHSPLYEDGTFELTPIPERGAWRRPMLRLRDVVGANANAPRSWAGRPVHLDPDLRSALPTYGDNCRRAGRAYTLRRAKPGDLIVFIARLEPATKPAAKPATKPAAKPVAKPVAKPPSFHLVGCLEITDAIEDVVRDPGPGWWDSNAHVRRARARRQWDAFWVFRGGGQTRQLAHAVPFARAEAAIVFGEWDWPSHRSELQTIGSHTRAVRRLEGAGEEWLRAACLS